MKTFKQFLLEVKAHKDILRPWSISKITRDEFDKLVVENLVINKTPSLFRGDKKFDFDYAILDTAGMKRASKDSKANVYNVCFDHMLKEHGFPGRSESIICSTSASTADEYSTNVYLIVPLKGKSKVITSNKEDILVNPIPDAPFNSLRRFDDFVYETYAVKLEQIFKNADGGFDRDVVETYEEAKELFAKITLDEDICIPLLTKLGIGAYMSTYYDMLSLGLPMSDKAKDDSEILAKYDEPFYQACKNRSALRDSMEGGSAIKIMHQLSKQMIMAADILREIVGAENMKDFHSYRSTTLSAIKRLEICAEICAQAHDSSSIFEVMYQRMFDIKHFGIKELEDLTKPPRNVETWVNGEMLLIKVSFFEQINRIP